MGDDRVKTKRIFALTPLLMLAAAGVLQAQGPAAVAEVQVAPEVVRLQENATSRLSALAYDAQGNVITTVRFRWVSNNVNVAVVDSTGLVTAVAPGTAVIRAIAVGSGRPPRHGLAAVTVHRRAP